ncbi:hypothetical protein WA026_002908 [Henosepilachna vigintioctopunctata]|uniref:Uncharacterized protein n=1 Tax=Henosepilachna vigintioctopunctata TaxID=420089 RepID=A0AAW1TN56_9CUCU
MGILAYGANLRSDTIWDCSSKWKCKDVEGEAVDKCSIEFVASIGHLVSIRIFKVTKDNRQLKMIHLSAQESIPLKKLACKYLRIEVCSVSIKSIKWRLIKNAIEND